MMRSPAVDNFLFDQPEVVREVMEALRDIVFVHVPSVQEQLKWNCPFYSKDGMLCYINYDRQLKCVVLVFVEGFLLQDKYGVLLSGTKNVRKLAIESVERINEMQIRYYLKQALKINKTKTKNFLAIQKRKI
jgi:hypothetical protein